MLRPPPPMLTSAWAEKYRYMPTELSTLPGKWRNDNTPYLVEPMDVEQLEPWIDTIIMQKASRMGGTEVVNNKMGRRIMHDACPMMYVQQSYEEALKYSNLILTPFLDNCEAVLDLLTLKNTMLKKFPGGNLTIDGAQTAKAFRMVQKRVAIGDDLDGWPWMVGVEGDPWEQLCGRTANDPNRLNIAISKPTLKGYSEIEKLMLTSDQRRWHAPCPICDHGQTFKWGGADYDFGIKWTDRNPATAYYLCEQCHKKIQHFQKRQMNLEGEWIKTAVPETPNVAGYYFNQIFSNFVTWTDLVTVWLRSYKIPNKLQVFFNDRMGETFEDNAAQVSDDNMLTRREDYGPKVPVGAWVLTAWADVQQDRIEAKVCGWGREGECWILEYKVLHGDPLFPPVWKELHEYLTAPREHETGLRLKIMASGVDSGFQKDKVYEFCRPRKALNIFPTKGSSTPDHPVMAERSSKNVLKDSKVHLYYIGTDTAKRSINRRLLVQEKGPAYIHFYLNPPPGCSTLDEEYFAGLTNTKCINTSKTKKPKLEWKKKIESAPDEQLDCMVGNLAMLNWLMQFKSFNLNKLCDQMERRALAMREAEAQDNPEQKAAPQRKRPRGKSWGTDWKK
jgi:phage terminase large subunit GpA-like protein